MKRHREEKMMDTAHMIKIGFIIMGIIMMGLSFWLHAKRMLTVNQAVVWEFLGFALILIGVIPALSNWCYLLGKGTAIAMFLIGIFAIWGAYMLCILISVLSLKTQELAMQVSLLSQENEMLLRMHQGEEKNTNNTGRS